MADECIDAKYCQFTTPYRDTTIGRSLIDAINPFINNTPDENKEAAAYQSSLILEAFDEAIEEFFSKIHPKTSNTLIKGNVSFYQINLAFKHLVISNARVRIDNSELIPVQGDLLIVAKCPQESVEEAVEQFARAEGNE